MQIVGFNIHACRVCKLKAHDPRHQAAYLFKLVIAKARVIIMDDGTQGRAVTTDHNGLIPVDVQQMLKCGDIPSLNITQALAIRALIGEIGPLSLSKGIEILDPPVIYPTLTEIIDDLNRQASTLRKLADRIAGALKR